MEHKTCFCFFLGGSHMYTDWIWVFRDGVHRLNLGFFGVEYTCTETGWGGWAGGRLGGGGGEVVYTYTQNESRGFFRWSTHVHRLNLFLLLFCCWFFVCFFCFCFEVVYTYTQTGSGILLSFGRAEDSTLSEIFFFFFSVPVKKDLRP